ncbi:DUF1622 domain-containing protein [Clostridium baratii]|uniref:Protein of uncharacterized function (DUF1622) n=1 Tax=Clostridium baratii TaxID=1561 RepID=A0A174TVU5_9CLOT|nr:DUF1622 domain-containing protein [Clostridium baratii]CUQ11530.1 Protein of uncharacterised function (DUF1622) [Clostridium baratii]
MDLKHILELVIYILNILSIIIIIWGVVLAFIAFIKSELSSHNRVNAIENNNIIKNHLGSYILFGLEILIGADIIESILNPTINDMIILASIVIIRTFISYFLNKEMESKKNRDCR